MKIQKAVALSPVFGGATSLDLTPLTSLLEEGWTVNQTASSINGTILVILDKPDPEPEAQG